MAGSIGRPVRPPDIELEHVVFEIQVIVTWVLSSWPWGGPVAARLLFRLGGHVNPSRDSSGHRALVVIRSWL